VDTKGSILVIDDEHTILGILDEYLTERGYEIVTAGTGAQALEAIEQRGFDVALVDLKLPDQDGIALIESFKKTCPDMKCVVMTAFASLESTIEALRLNAFDYILKPFDLIKIGEVVDAAYNDSLLNDRSGDKFQELEDNKKLLEESKEDLQLKILKANEKLVKASESIDRHVMRLKMLYQMGRDISTNEDWSDSLDRFLMALSNYLETDGTGLLLFSDFGRMLKVRTAYHIEEELIDSAAKMLLGVHSRDLCPSEVFHLESCEKGEVTTCLAMKEPWEHTVIPLLYKGRWLGFLLLKKMYGSRRAYLNDYHFIHTIQTILTEEVANAVNISRLRNLKNFNETLLDNINSGVISTDNIGLIVFMNGRAHEMLGEVGGVYFQFNDLFANPFGSGGLFDHLILQDQRNMSIEGTLRVPDGGSVPVRLNTTVVDIDEYHGKTVVAIFDDLTEQKAMEEELRRADRLRSLGELSAGVAHEIRNPLTGIATTAQVLKEKLENEPEKAEYITVILDEIKRLDDIIKNLLTFARPIVPEPAEFRIGKVLEESIALMKEKASERDVDLKLQVEVEDDTCLVDGDQMKQVALNLIMNGIEACDQGGEILILIKEAGERENILVEFSDTGEGIQPDAADKLYNPFFTTRAEGTGLGLSITRKIIESHGGHIRHESTQGEGTRFYVEFPRRVAAAGRLEETKTQ
jgi:signal transduction histidine kinase/DNA-binding response OmpR family regulator